MMFNQQALNKAKVKIAFSGILSCLFFFAGMTGCKKEIGQLPESLSNAAVLDRSEVTPTVTHSMLHFDSFADLSAFTQST